MKRRVFWGVNTLVSLSGSFHFMYFYCCWQTEVLWLTSHEAIVPGWIGHHDWDCWRKWSSGLLLSLSSGFLMSLKSLDYSPNGLYSEKPCSSNQQSHCTFILVLDHVINCKLHLADNHGKGHLQYIYYVQPISTYPPPSHTHTYLQCNNMYS